MVNTRARLLVAVLLTSAWGGGIAAQLMPGQRIRPPQGSATMTGSVVDSAQPPRPVRRARVTVRPEGIATGWSTTTDDEGRFALTGIAAGRYVLEAEKPAWIIGRYGAARPGRPGIPIAVNDGATLQGLRISMSRGAVISGTVLSRSGDPVPGVTVSAISAGGRNPALDATTDEEGRFRVFGLSPGEYAVRATPVWRTGPVSAFMDIAPQTDAQVQTVLQGAPMPATGTVGYAPVYAPGVSLRTQALTIKVGAEEERDGITITLNPVATRRITVSVDVGDIGDAATVQLLLASGDPAGSQLTGRRTGSAPFVFAGVAPIPYTAIAHAARVGAVPLAAVPAGPPARGRGPTVPLTLYAIEELGVSGGDLNVALRLQPGMKVSGRVVVEAGAPDSTRASEVAFALLPTRQGPAPGVPSVRSNADGAFLFDGVPPGRYRLVQAGNVAFDMKSAMSRGVDVLDALLEVRAGEDISDLVVTVPARSTELTGRLETSAGAAAPDYYIVVFAADKQFWTPQSRRISQTRPANDGRFAVKGLPAGEYLVAALTDIEPGEWFEPAFLEGLIGAAVRVTIRDGTTTTQDLRIR